MTMDPTQWPCPSAPQGDNSTHHLRPTQGGAMVCRTCLKTREQLINEHAKNPVVYDRFERNVRREYFFVRRPRYIAGRSAVLQSFLDRPRIYGTDWFFARYEAAARQNLTHALAALHGGSA